LGARLAKARLANEELGRQAVTRAPGGSCCTICCALLHAERLHVLVEGLVDLARDHVEIRVPSLRYANV
jgi:hypothetical protein